MTRLDNIKPITGKRAWKTKDMQHNPDWTIYLSSALQDELLCTITEAYKNGDNTTDAAFTNYNIPALHELAKTIQRGLFDGAGFQLLKGLPIKGLNQNEIEFMLMVLGHHLGIVTPQTGDKPEVGNVMDNGSGSKRFYYNRGGALPMHMDPVDVVALLCIRKAKKGGESSIASSMSVHNEILKSRPDLLNILYRGYRHHRRHADGDAEKKLLTDHYCPIFYPLEKETICSIIPHVIEGAVEEGLLTFTKLEAEALQYFKETALRNDIQLPMDLEPGDLQLLNNRAILHSRLDYEDYPEPERRRLLLRLWLTMPDWQKLPSSIPHKDAELSTTPA